MTTTREALLAEALFQQSYAVSDSIHEGPAVGFVGLAFVTANNQVFGGHAIGENYLAAATNALSVLTARYKLAAATGEASTPLLDVSDAVLVTARNLDEITPTELALLKEKLGLPAEHQIDVRREVPKAKAALQP